MKQSLPSARTVLLIVLVAMILLVIVLQIVIRRNPALRESREMTFAEIYAQYGPQENDIDALFATRLGENELHAQSQTISTLDSNAMNVLVSKPAGAGPFPTYILFHDGLSSPRTTRQLSDGLGEQILKSEEAIVITADSRQIQNLNSLSLDVHAVLRWTQDVVEIDLENIVLIGEGIGAHTTLQAMRDNTEQIKNLGGIVLIDPFINPAAVWRHLQSTNEQAAVLFPPAFRCQSTAGEETDIERCLTEFTLDTLTQLDVPVVVAKRTAAQRVPSEQVDTVIERLGGDAGVTTVEFKAEGTEASIDQWKVGDLATQEFINLLNTAAEKDEVQE